MIIWTLAYQYHWTQSRKQQFNCSCIWHVQKTNKTTPNHNAYISAMFLIMTKKCLNIYIVMSDYFVGICFHLYFCPVLWCNTVRGIFHAFRCPYMVKWSSCGIIYLKINDFRYFIHWNFASDIVCFQALLGRGKIQAMSKMSAWILI